MTKDSNIQMGDSGVTLYFGWQLVYNKSTGTFMVKHSDDFDTTAFCISHPGAAFYMNDKGEPCGFVINGEAIKHAIENPIDN